MSIIYNYESDSYKKFSEDLVNYTVHEILKLEGYTLKELEYWILSDLKLLEINRDFLNHDYLTDVITFDETFLKKISGSIYISFERIVENSVQLDVNWLDEFFRVMIHGVLHLVGYKDSTDEDRRIMRDKEDYYLKVLGAYQDGKS